MATRNARAYIILPQLMRRVAPLIVLFVLGCAPAEARHPLVSEHMDSWARSYIQLLVDGELDRLRDHLAPELRRREELADSLQVVHRALPDSTHTIELAGAERIVTAEYERRRIWYQLRSDSAAVLLSLALQDGLPPLVWGLHSQQLPAPLQEIHAFRPWERSFVLSLLLMIPAGMVAFSLYAAVRVLRCRMQSRWLWAAVALIGVGKVTLNWTTGSFSQSLLSIQLLGAGFVRLELLGPWLISFSFPLGAILALSKVRQAAMPFPEMPEVQSAPPTPAGSDT